MRLLLHLPQYQGNCAEGAWKEMRIWQIEVYYQWTRNDPWELWEPWKVKAETIQEAIEKAVKAEQNRFDDPKENKPKFFEAQKASLLVEVDLE